MTPTDGRRSRRAPVVILIIVVVVAVLVGALAVADNVARGIAEKQVAAQVAAGIPGADPRGVTVRIGGFSFLAQLAAGRFDSIVVDAANVTVSGSPIALHARAESVPTDRAGAISDLQGYAMLDDAAVNALVAQSGNDAKVTLGEGQVDYEVTRKFLGIPLSFAVSASAAPRGGFIAFTPKSAKLTAGGASFDVSSIVDAVLRSSGFSVCVASQLPAGLTVSDIAIRPGRARVDFTAKDLVLADASTKGRC